MIYGSLVASGSTVQPEKALKIDAVYCAALHDKGTGIEVLNDEVCPELV